MLSRPACPPAPAALPGPLHAEALKTIALVLHGAGRGRASFCESRDIIVHALILVRQSEGALDPDAARRWLEEEAGLPVGRALMVRELAEAVADGREIGGLGRSPLRESTLQVWRERAAGRDASPFDRLRDALRGPAAAAP